MQTYLLIYCWTERQNQEMKNIDIISKKMDNIGMIDLQVESMIDLILFISARQFLYADASSDSLMWSIFIIYKKHL